MGGDYFTRDVRVTTKVQVKQSVMYQVKMLIIKKGYVSTIYKKQQLRIPFLI